ncbi:MAG: tyrosine--tRNA ligase [Patescibacteria group bacterium]
MNLFAELKERGLICQVSNENGVKELLNKKSAYFYVGFDPSAESLHIGNLFVIVTAKRLEKAGLKPIILVGGATGLIGDPSGKNQERILPLKEIIGQNTEFIKKQLEKFFDFKKGAAIFVNNQDWFKDIYFIDFIRDIGKKFNVNEMLAKESVKNRLKTGVSFTEFSYMLIQAYDFLNIYKKHGCELQIGGSDQWGNITAGIDLVRKIEGKEIFGMTLPLVEGPSGKKFGKSEEGVALWLDEKLTSPYHFYQFWFNVGDDDAVKYLKYYSFLSLGEIKTLEDSLKKEPEKREAQKALARNVTAFVHGEEAFEKARKISEDLFGSKIKNLTKEDMAQIFNDSSMKRIESFPPTGGNLNIVDFLVLTGVASSKRQGREDVQNNTIELNGKKINDVNCVIGGNELLFGKYIIIKHGKKDYHFLKSSGK